MNDRRAKEDLDRVKAGYYNEDDQERDIYDTKYAAAKKSKEDALKFHGQFLQNEGPGRGTMTDCTEFEEHTIFTFFSIGTPERSRQPCTQGFCCANVAGRSW